MGRVIAIDGPSGSGKGTVSKIIAEKLGYTYLDTGGLYRAVALKLRRATLDEHATDAEIERVLAGTSLSYDSGILLLDGIAVGEEIRTTEIGHFSSVFSARRVVRDYLLGIQRAAAARHDLVAEGRDMATVVFPGAYRKFFLTASPEERARRRYRQLREKGVTISREEAERDVRERDVRDSARDLAPLAVADDAVVIDSTSLTIEETVAEILERL